MIKVFKKLSTIEQGLSPIDIRRYQTFIRNLIVERGLEGDLDTYLVSPGDLESLDESNGNIVVAIGDRKNFFVMPDFHSYIKDYLFDEDTLLPNLALEFIARENAKARTPFRKHLNRVKLKQSNLKSNEIDNIESYIIYMLMN